MEKHAQIYESCLKEFCANHEIGVTFNCISSYSQSHLPQSCRVPQFVVVEEGFVLEKIPSEAEIIHLLGLEGRITLDTRAGRRATKLFLKRLSLSDNNLTVASGYIHTFITLTPLVTGDAHIRLGLEMVDIFLALTSADPSSPQSKMPAINVLVE